MKKELLFLIIFFSLQLFGVRVSLPQGQPDIRLDNNHIVSHTSGNRWCVAAGENEMHGIIRENNNGFYEVYYKLGYTGDNIYAVDSVLPRSNLINVPLSSNMRVYFNQGMNAATLDSNSITVFGSMTGLKQAVVTYNSGNSSVQIIPNIPFKYGELISTTLDSGIKTGSGNSITPYVWNFTTLGKPSSLVFSQTSASTVGTGPGGFTAGDFNKDGYIDIAAANTSSNNISILINNGNGTFTKQSPDINVGNQPRDIISGDLDNDGYLDLATCNWGSSGISILKNNGNGTFVLSSNVPTGSGTTNIAKGDFDGDGFLELAVSHQYSWNITILKNTGNWTFSISSTISTGDFPYDIAVGDFDNDGDLDMAVAIYYNNSVSLFKNNGNGTFNSFSSLGVGNNPQGIIAGDFDVDGDLDLAVTNYSSSNFNILKNNGSGTFSIAQTIGAGYWPWRMGSGDLDGDGDLDLVLSCYPNTYLFKNDGSGTFTFSSIVMAGGDPRTLTGDFNNDGLIDIAILRTSFNDVDIFTNLSSPPLLNPANNSTGNLNAINFAWQKSLGAANYRIQVAADSLFSSLIMNDSTLQGTDSVKSLSGLNALTWYYWRMNSKSANGTSLWSNTWKFKTQGVPAQVNLSSPANNSVNQPFSITFQWYKGADQTSANRSESSKSNKISNLLPPSVGKYWFEYSTDSTFTSGTVRDSLLTDTTKTLTGLYKKTRYYWRVKAKNETGWSNFSTAWSFMTTYFIDSVSPGQNKLNIPLNSNLNVWFHQTNNSSTIDSNSVTFFGSMTGRRQGAISYNSGTNSLQIIPNNPFKFGELISTTLDSGIKTGSGSSIVPFVWSFTTLSKPSNSVFNKTDTTVVGNGPIKIITGDFDGDGNIDLAVTNASSNTVSILKNNGAGIFNVSSENSVGSSPCGLVAGDFDNDGDLDLAVDNGPSVTIFKNNGNGTFIFSSNVGVGSATLMAAGDIDGDGDLDLVVSNRNSNNISVLKNNGTGTFSVSSTIGANSPQGIAIGDFDNDGDLDFAVVEYWGSRVLIFKNDGTGSFTLSYAYGVGGNTDQVITGDFDNDGYLDLAVTNNGSSYISIFKNNGTGAFTGSNVGAAGLTGITQGDFDGDGFLDLAVDNYGLHTVTIYKNNGTGTFTQSSTIGAGVYPFYITTGDFNNDGVLDLAVNNFYSSSVTVLMNLTPPQLLSPANNSVGNLNTLNFVWKKSRGAGNYRVQIATDSLFNNLVVNDSTLLGTDSLKSVSGLNALTWYFWRMKSKSANGTSLWSDTWKFKTIGSPFAINLISPANNSLNQPISINFTWSRATEQTTPFSSGSSIKSALLHDGVLGIGNYWFDLVTDTVSLANLVRDTTLTDTTKSINGLSNLTNYYWRVRAKNEIGWGSYSSWYKFTTIVSAPQAPLLVSPLNNANAQNCSLALVWNKSIAAESYRVQVSTDSLFSSLIINDSTLIDSTRSVSGLSPLTYYWWRVNAKNIGGTGNYSTAWEFRTVGSPFSVILVSPANNAVNQPISLTCLWHRATEQTSSFSIIRRNNEIGDEIDGVSNYWFDMVTDTTSLANLLRDTTLTDTSKSVSGLGYTTKYYWRVKAKNQIGWGSFSVWFNFTTQPPPPAQVNLTVIPGGFYDPYSGMLNFKDTLWVLLVDSATCSIVDSARVRVDSVTFSANLSYSLAPTGKYYIYVLHRNHLTISSRYTQNIIRGSNVSYDFTTDSVKTYGFNVVKVSTSPVMWGMIPGDANQDGYVDGLDQSVWVAQNGANGYFPADFNGDTYVDGLDQTIWVITNGQSSSLPCYFSFVNLPGPDKQNGQPSRVIINRGNNNNNNINKAIRDNQKNQKQSN
jgi:hypothetical protein